MAWAEDSSRTLAAPNDAAAKLGPSPANSTRPASLTSAAMAAAAPSSATAAASISAGICARAALTPSALPGRASWAIAAAKAHNKAMAAVLDCVGQPERVAWTCNPASNPVSTGLPSVLDTPTTIAPRECAACSAAMTAGVFPPALRPITKVRASATAAP